jgi:hypothetical protein
MPGNRKNQPCNRCLEFKAHPNHDLTAEREARKAGMAKAAMKMAELKRSERANAIAEKRYGYANIAVSPQESLKRRATDAESPHTRENLEAYVRQCEARLKETTSPWMKAEVRKGIELAKRELAAMGTAKDVRRIRLHRALDAVMDGVKARDVKIKPEDVAYIERAVQSVVQRYPVEKYKAEHPGLSDTRMRWDYLHAANIGSYLNQVYKYADDSNIETILKRVVK